MRNFIVILLVMFAIGCNKNSESSDKTKLVPASPIENGDRSKEQQEKLIRFRNVQNWKVGDTLIYKTGGSCCESRYYVRKVVSETQDGFWLCGDLGYSTSVEMTTECNPIQQFLVRKTDGVVIKEYAGMWGIGVPKSYWLTDSLGQEKINVPLGEYNTSFIEGKFFLNPPRNEFWGMQKWYAEELPLDGLVQQFNDAHTSDPGPYLTIKLVKAIRGAH